MKSNLETIIPIKGMHCASCEIIIAEELAELDGVVSAKASLKTNSATVISTKKVAESDIEDAVEKAGYEVGYDDEHPELINRNGRIWLDVGIGVAVLVALWMIFRMFDIDQLSASLTSGTSVGMMALVVGITAGFSTCMALVGGLVLGVSSKHAENNPNQTSWQKFRPHIIFNIGRIVSFVVLGALIGILGSAFAVSGGLLGWLTIVVSIVMLGLGLQLTEISPRITKGLTLPSGLAKALKIDRFKSAKYSNRNTFTLGALTFFLPCGFTQAMQLLAISTGDPSQAALIMGAFAIGTTPGLLGLGGLTSTVSGGFAKRFFRIVGVVVVAMAFINLSNGLTLSGVSQWFDNRMQSNQVNTQNLDPNTKILQTTYRLREDIIPSEFTTKVGQKTALVVDVKDNGQGCMSTIMIIGLYDKPIYLQKGRQLQLEFTATKPGKYTIACAMGVPRGTITVTADDATNSETSDQETK